MDTLVDVLLAIKPFVSLAIVMGLLCGGALLTIKGVRAIRAQRLVGLSKSLLLLTTGLLLVIGAVHLDTLRIRASSAEPVPACGYGQTT